MVDLEWIESLEHDGAETDGVRSKEELIEDFEETSVPVLTPDDYIKMLR